MKWTRQRCQVAWSTLLTAALMPSWASEITSLTPRKPRRASLRRNAVQNVSASEGPMSRPRISRRPSPLTPTATITATETMRLFDQLVDRSGRDALDVGLLDHRGERLFGHPPRLQEPGEVAALAQLGDAQLDHAGARLPDAVAIAVGLGKPIGALLAEAGASQASDFQLHQPLSGKADHLAQQIGVGGLLHKRAQVHHLVGHRWFLESGWCRNPTLPANHR